MLNPNGKVVLFGASILGKTVLDFLDAAGVTPLCFIDNDERKQQGSFHGLPVFSFKHYQQHYSGTQIIIAANRYLEEIKQQLTQAGETNFISCFELFSSFDWEKLDLSKLQKVFWVLAKDEELSKHIKVPETALHLPRLNVVITTRCTLRCRDCSSLIPHYQKHSDFSLKQLCNDIESFFKHVDMIYHLEVLGGEPFMHKELPEIVKFIVDSGKVLHLDVVTNGTLLPSQKVLEQLHYENLSVVIDDYGPSSPKLQLLADTLTREGIDFRINRHWAWADLGGFEARQRSDAQNRAIFSSCNFNTCAEMLNGRIFRCPRSSHGTALGVVPDYPGDYLEISRLGAAPAPKEVIRQFFAEKCLRSCDHCNGNSPETLKLKVAEQTGVTHE